MNDPGQNIIAFLFEFGVHPGGPQHGVAVDQRCWRFSIVWRGGIVMKEEATNRDIEPESGCCRKSRVSHSQLPADDKSSQLIQLDRNHCGRCKNRHRSSARSLDTVPVSQVLALRTSQSVE